MSPAGLYREAKLIRDAVDNATRRTLAAVLRTLSRLDLATSTPERRFMTRRLEQL